ncbi:hypothetical protein OG989_04220 [Micromonospora sp. NBC_01740]|uniref:hypothetical protein n=1 Tax=Micromonospora sp. NBC_01740 TaxID=2975986 RepID=UPI002E147725|nr:hypothetical protein OG989_04220 [Micromonospora sp. NBC_01740]
MPGARNDDGYFIEPYVFESTVTQPDGIRVHVSISVPPDAAWKDTPETAEVAQMTASRALAQINASKERVPF